MNNTKLGGALIGYGLKRNGVEHRVMFDKPIHNTITKHCLNNLLMFNGGNGLASDNLQGNMLSLLVKSEAASGRYGVFNFSALGSNGSSTSTDDVALKDRKSDYTSTKKGGVGWCGTSIDSANAIMNIRISHKHIISSSFTIREIGWFNRIYPDGEYSLSARVVLDKPLDVEDGDEFYSIYELHVGFQDVEVIDDFFGLGPAIVTNGCFVTNNSSDITPNFPAINTSGNPYLNQTAWSNPGTYAYDMAPVYRPPYLTAQGSYTSYGRTTYFPYSFYENAGAIMNFFTTNVPKFKPFLYNYIHQRPGVFLSDLSVKPYTIDSFYRDICINVSSSAFSSPIYAISFLGSFVRFGSYNENNEFVPRTIQPTNNYRFTIRQSWSTDLLSPTA